MTGEVLCYTAGDKPERRVSDGTASPKVIVRVSLRAALVVSWSAACQLGSLLSYTVSPRYDWPLVSRNTRRHNAPAAPGQWPPLASI